MSVIEQDDINKSLDCLHCEKTFGRLEHLKRHELSHSKPQFHCKVCSKQFIRKDGLQRHEQTHEDSRSLVNTKGRACIRCVDAKAKCSGGPAVCGRCLKRDLVCFYPPISTTPAQLTRTVATPPSDSSRNSQQSRHVTEIQPDPSSLPVERFEAHQLAAQSLTTSNDFQEDVHRLSEAQPFCANNHSIRNDDFDMGSIHADNFDFITSFSNVNPSSSVNWLQPEFVNLDYADLGETFPFGTLSTYDLNGTNNAEIHDRDPMLPFNETISEPAQILHRNPKSQHRPSASHLSHDAMSAPRSPMSTSTDLSSYGHIIDGGEYYVNGDGARLPRVKRRRLYSVSMKVGESPKTFSLASISGLDAHGNSIEHCSKEQYDTLSAYHKRLCLDTGFFIPFTNPGLLSRASLSQLVDLALQNFISILPIFNLPTFTGRDKHFATLVVLAALGAFYLDNAGEEAEMLCLSLLEYGRRLFMLSYEDSDCWPSDDLENLQIKLLYFIAANYSGEEHLKNFAGNMFWDCTVRCSEHWPMPNPQNSDQSDIRQWSLWVQREETIRTYFAVWLLDCLLAAQEQRSPSLSLPLVTGYQLPCNDQMWTASSVDQWQMLQRKLQASPSLRDALQNLYVEKRLLPGLGEFSQILLVHAIYQRTWEVQAYFQQGLSHVEPSAQKQSSTDVQTSIPVWHPLMTTLNKWRNAACDCIDILHWRANATIGLASGMEHPTVLHLHFSRVVLLAPLAQIVRLARHIAAVAPGTGNQLRHAHGTNDAEDDKQHIQQWVIQDQYKARLAAIHAGVLFWHVRRYAANAFYEPNAVALSTLMMWALSIFSPKTTKDQLTDEETGEETRSRSSGEASEPTIQDTCNIILIDRPTDDVLVQQFVRQGNNMQALMTGVGDLFGPCGAQRVLVQGYKLLSTLTVWRRSTTPWLILLKRLEKATANIRRHAA